MARHLITPANAADIARAQPGDTLVLSGSFPKQALTGLSNLTILAHDATLGNWLFSKCSGVQVYGGTVTLGLGFVDCAGVGFHDMALGGAGAKGIGAGFQRTTGASVTHNIATGWDHVLTFDRCRDLLVTHNDISGFGSDAINLGNPWGATIRRNTIHDPATNALAHPDAIQGRQVAGEVPPCDVAIIDNDLSGQLQGVFLQDNTKAGWDRVEIRGNTVEAAGRGISASGVRGLVLRGNHVSTLPTSTIIANIYAENCADIDRGGNIVADAPWIGLHGKRGWTEP